MEVIQLVLLAVFTLSVAGCLILLLLMHIQNISDRLSWLANRVDSLEQKAVDSENRVSVLGNPQ